MSIKIHHGPAGSYKTSGAVQDDFIPAAKEGRIVVTNIRGLDDRSKIYEALGDLPESFEIHNFPTSDHADAAQNRELFAKFFHWLPKGALFIVDEAQMIFPKHWTAKDIHKLDYPGGIEAANAAGRPSDLWIAFDMHRHYNWDIILTTTNINKIRDDIRNVSDMAYRHRNMATIGIKGRYFETQHQPEDNGASEANQIQTRQRKIDKRVWGLYASTATGVITDTKAGLSLFKSPKVVFLLLVLSLVCSYLLYNREHIGVHPVTSPAASPSSAAPGQPGTPPSSVSVLASNPSSNTRPDPNVLPVKTNSASVLDPFSQFKIRIYGSTSQELAGSTSRRIFFELYSRSETMRLSSYDLANNGYTVIYQSPCSVRLVYQTVVRFIGCAKARYLQDENPRIIEGGLRVAGEEVRRAANTQPPAAPAFDPDLSAQR